MTSRALLRRRGTWPIGERHAPSSCTNAHTSPPAPKRLACSVSASSSERGTSRAPALSPRTTPPEPSTLCEDLELRAPERVADVGRSPGRSARRACRSRSAASPRRTASAATAAPGTSKPASSNTRAIRPSISVDDVVLLDEGHLEVELGELGLAEAAQVLVAEAAGDLVVALVAAHHQQLLEQLRRLRQRVERARPHARRARGSRARPRAWSAVRIGVSMSRKSRALR